MQVQEIKAKNVSSKLLPPIFVNSSNQAKKSFSTNISSNYIKDLITKKLSSTTCPRRTNTKKEEDEAQQNEFCKVNEKLEILVDKSILIESAPKKRIFKVNKL